MNWTDERYVRVYTRDTTDWLAMSWQAQGLFCLLLRKVDRAGLLDLGKRGKAGLASHIGGPAAWRDLESALEELLADGCVELVGTSLVVRNFIEAQEAKQSDKVRQAESRNRRRDQARGAKGAAVTKRDTSSRNVTESHAASPAVTSGHTTSQNVTPSRAVPYRAEPAKDSEPPFGASPTSPLLVLEEAPGRTGAPSPQPSPACGRGGPRKPSAQESFWGWFQAEREKRFPGELPDKHLDAKVLNAVLKEPLRLAGELALRRGALAYLGSAFARNECSPPGAFAPFIANYARHIPRIGATGSALRDPGGRNGASVDDQDPAAFEPTAVSP